MALIEIPEPRPGLRAKLEHREHKRRLEFKAAAAKLAPLIPGMTEERLLDDMGRIYCGNPYPDTEKDTERASEAKKALERLQVAAEALAGAMKGLGPGALAVLGRGRTPDTQTWEEARVWELLDRSGSFSYPHGFPEDEIWRAEEEWRRGGKWLIRLEALAKVARWKARRIGEHFPSRCGNKALGRMLWGDAHDALLEACASYLEKHGADLTKTLGPLAEAIYRAETGEKAPSTIRTKAAHLREARLLK